MSLTMPTRLDVVDEPVPLRGILHLVEFVTDGAAVDVLEPIQHLEHRGSEVLQLDR